MSQSVVAGHGTKFDLKVTEDFLLNQAIGGTRLAVRIAP